MFYKLYRRRKFIYIGLFLLGVLFLAFNQNLPASNENRIKSLNYKIENDEFNKNPNVNNQNLNLVPNPNLNPMHNLKQNNGRINMQNYVEPEPCVGCPGENGNAVFLSVK